ncbi:MAG: hypothetical protein R3Y12_01620 [Clostridia bacterium]
MSIILGIATFYGVVTKPIKDCVTELKDEIRQMNIMSHQTREELIKVIESNKSAHKRLDKLEEEANK